MPKMMAAAVMAVMLAVSAAPARSAETATADDTARFLAGLPPAASSPLAALTKDPSWQQHARYFNSIFAREDSNTLSKVRAFSKEHLTDKHDTMLYMFSGPDFLYATSFFPGASTYVLAGLEPAGDIPQLTSLSRPAVNGTLRNLETSMGSLLSYSFFITQKMKTQLHEGPVYGTLPVLYVFLARTGKTIHDVSLVSLDEQGNFQTADDPAATGAKARKAVRSAAQGVKIVFSDGNGPKQTLYYFSTNLADGSFERSGFSGIPRQARASRQFHKERVLSAPQRRLQQSARVSCSTTARRSCRTTAAFRWPISIRKNGGCSHLAVMSVRSIYSDARTSLEWRSCSGEPPRSTLASGIDGGGMNRICCWLRREPRRPARN